VHMDAPKYLQTYSLGERALHMDMLADCVIEIYERWRIASSMNTSLTSLVNS
jgi:hypothetical protein